MLWHARLPGIAGGRSIGIGLCTAWIGYGARVLGPGSIGIIRVVGAGLSWIGLWPGILQLRHARLSLSRWLPGETRLALKSRLALRPQLARHARPSPRHRLEILHVGTGHAIHEIAQVIAMFGPVIRQAGLKEILCKLKSNWDEERRGCAGAEK